jgi:hypothetical protein
MLHGDHEDWDHEIQKQQQRCKHNYAAVPERPSLQRANMGLSVQSKYGPVGSCSRDGSGKHDRVYRVSRREDACLI